jgi:hypothetical protein
MKTMPEAIEQFDSEDWKAWKKDSQEKRAANRDASAEILRTKGIAFESKNGGAHLIVHGFDFWPGTGKWVRRRDGRKGRGVNNLIALLKIGT